MSKTLDKLNGIHSARSKFTNLMNTQEEQTTEDKPTSDVMMFDKQIFMLAIACFALIGLLSLTLSFKAFAQIQNKNASMSQLVNIVVKQDEKIKNLNSSIAKFDSYQSEQFKDIKKSIAVIDKVVTRSEREVSELAIDSNLIHVVVNDLKKNDEVLESKYLDLSDEVSVLKSLKAENVQ